MKSAARKYLKISRQRDARRAEFLPDPLPQHEEVWFTGELDKCWQKMSDAEQDYVERELDA